MKRSKLLLLKSVIFNSAIAIQIATFSQTARASLPTFSLDNLDYLTNPLSPYINPINQQIDNWLEQFEKVANLKFGSISVALGTDVKQVVEQAKGVLGLPDVKESRLKIETDPNSKFLPYAPVDAANTITAEVASSNAQSSALGSNAQARTKQQLEMVYGAAKQSGEIATACQGEVITQNVMKCQILQSSNLASIMADLGATQKQMQINDALQTELSTRHLLNDDAERRYRQATEQIGPALRNRYLSSAIKLF
ncbi:MAG TPA: hypothetical protein V6D15_00390 [Oculatellaceae cyanobacterium]|jgi:hypothetical protein